MTGVSCANCRYYRICLSKPFFVIIPADECKDFYPKEAA